LFIGVRSRSKDRAQCREEQQQQTTAATTLKKQHATSTTTRTTATTATATTTMATPWEKINEEYRAYLEESGLSKEDFNAATPAERMSWRKQQQQQNSK
jgi:hypothetical protein